MLVWCDACAGIASVYSVSLVIASWVVNPSTLTEPVRHTRLYAHANILFVKLFNDSVSDYHAVKLV